MLTDCAEVGRVCDLFWVESKYCFSSSKLAFPVGAVIWVSVAIYCVLDVVCALGGLYACSNNDIVGENAVGSVADILPKIVLFCDGCVPSSGAFGCSKGGSPSEVAVCSLCVLLD